MQKFEVTDIINFDELFSPVKRYDYHRVFWIKEGKGTISIDFKPFDILSGQIYFLSPSALVSIEDCTITSAQLLIFNNEFLYANSNDDDFLVGCNLLDNPQEPFLNLSNFDFDFINLLSLMKSEFLNIKSENKSKILRNYLRAFLLKAEDHKKTPEIKPELTEYCTLFLNFKKKISQNVQLHRPVSQYAEELNISSKSLNTLVKKMVGTTAARYINNRILLEAKRQLYFEHKSIKEIAFYLGYNDPSNFTRNFKKLEGISPETFRKELLR